MQILITVFYKSNIVLFKLLFNYPISTSFQVLTNDSVSFTTTTYNYILGKLYTSYNFDDDKLCKVFLKVKIINNNTNSLQLQGIDISSEYPLNTTIRIID